MSTKSVADVSPSLALPSEWHDHRHLGRVVQFYTGDGFLLHAISRFIGTALVAGDSAVVIATQAHREGVFSELKARGIDCAASSCAAAIQIAKLLWKSWAGFLVARGQRQSAVIAVFPFSEKWWALLWAEGNSAAAIALEDLWNDLAKPNRSFFVARTQWPNFHLAEHSESFLKICNQHSSVVPAESYTALPGEERRLREITHLHQRAQALENEIAARRHAENALRLAHDELEKRLAERTLELEGKIFKSQNKLKPWNPPTGACASSPRDCCAFKTKNEGASCAIYTTAPLRRWLS
jgi:hypothetical protein